MRRANTFQRRRGWRAALWSGATWKHASARAARSALGRNQDATGSQARDPSSYSQFVHNPEVSLQPMSVLHITPSERGVLEELARGAETADIARRLGISEAEVESCLASL